MAMASFKKIQEMFYLGLIEEIIDKEELVRFRQHSGLVIFLKESIKTHKVY